MSLENVVASPVLHRLSAVSSHGECCDHCRNHPTGSCSAHAAVVRNSDGQLSCLAYSAASTTKSPEIKCHASTRRSLLTEDEEILFVAVRFMPPPSPPLLPPPSPRPPPAPLDPGTSLGSVFRATYVAEFESLPGAEFDSLALQSVLSQVVVALEKDVVGGSIDVSDATYKVLPRPPLPPPSPPSLPPRLPPLPLRPPPLSFPTLFTNETNSTDSGDTVQAADWLEGNRSFSTGPRNRRLLTVVAGGLSIGIRNMSVRSSVRSPHLRGRSLSGYCLPGMNDTDPSIHQVQAIFVTSDEQVFLAIIAAFSSISTNSTLAAGIRVTNTAGQVLQRCTSPWLEEVGREVIPAPPSSVSTVAGLVPQNFVNVSSVATKALGLLLTQSSATIATAATAAAASAVAASAAASAIGGAGGGGGPAGAVKALQGAQRLGMYAKLAGPPEDGDDGGGGGITAGRLGFRLSGDGVRRRLAAVEVGGGGSGGSVAGGAASGDSSVGTLVTNGTEATVDLANPITVMLVNAMFDTLMTVTLFLFIVTGIHILLLLFWRHLANRKYYMWRPPAVAGRSYRQCDAQMQMCCTQRVDQVVAFDDAVTPRAGAPTSAGTVALSPPPSPAGQRYRITPSDVDNATQPCGGGRVAVDSLRSARSLPDRQLMRSRLSLGVHRQKLTRMRYGKARVLRRPKFRSIPPILRFPTLQKYCLITFAPALVTTSMAVLGAHAGGKHCMISSHLALSSFCLVVVFSFFAMEVWTLLRFRRLFHDDTWYGADPPCSNAEVDDPALAILGKLRVIQPRVRLRGGYECPQDDMREPARTERALNRVFGCKFWRYCGGGEERPGDVIETLPMWLDHANHGQGIYYSVMQIGLQLAMAILVGLLYAHPWQGTTSGGITELIVLIVILIVMCIWVMMTTSNDIYVGFEAAMGYLFELVATCLVLASNVLSEAASDDDINEVAKALSLAQFSAQLLVWSAFIPILFTVYDTFIVPLALLCWKSEVGWWETACQVVVTVVLLPLSLLEAITGSKVGGNANEFVGQMEDSIVGSAGHMQMDATQKDDSGIAAIPDDQRKHSRRSMRRKKWRKRALDPTPSHRPSTADARTVLSETGAVPHYLANETAPGQSASNATARALHDARNTGTPAEVVVLADANERCTPNKAAKRRAAREHFLHRVRAKTGTIPEHIDNQQKKVILDWNPWMTLAGFVARMLSISWKKVAHMCRRSSSSSRKVADDGPVSCAQGVVEDGAVRSRTATHVDDGNDGAGALDAVACMAKAITSAQTVAAGDPVVSGTAVVFVKNGSEATHQSLLEPRAMLPAEDAVTTLPQSCTIIDVQASNIDTMCASHNPPSLPPDRSTPKPVLMQAAQMAILPKETRQSCTIIDVQASNIDTMCASHNPLPLPPDRSAPKPVLMQAAQMAILANKVRQRTGPRPSRAAPPLPMQDAACRASQRD